MSYPEEERERQQPESITFAQFKGIRNTVAAKRLGPDELEKAQNVDVDDAEQLRRRRGYAQVSSGSFHSVWTGDTRTYGVKDGALGVINPDYSFTSLQSDIGPTRVSFDQIGEIVYFSSATNSGKIADDGTVSSWGAEVSAGTWLSPVVNPTSTLNPVDGKLLKAPPLATAIASGDGRMWLAHGTLLWATELYLYDYVDSTRTFFQFESPITALGSVGGGLYVGTEQATYFMSGPLGARNRTKIRSSGIIPGSVVSVDAELVGPERSASKQAIMYMTNDGLCVGLDDGVSYNMTETRVLFPQAVSAAAMFRKQDGINQYVGAIDSAGTPTSTARVGDYVDAEIRRFQGD